MKNFVYDEKYNKYNKKFFLLLYLPEILYLYIIDLS